MRQSGRSCPIPPNSKHKCGRAPTWVCIATRSSQRRWNKTHYSLILATLWLRAVTPCICVCEYSCTTLHTHRKVRQFPTDSAHIHVCFTCRVCGGGYSRLLQDSGSASASCALHMKHLQVLSIGPFHVSSIAFGSLNHTVTNVTHSTLIVWTWCGPGFPKIKTSAKHSHNNMWSQMSAFAQNNFEQFYICHMDLPQSKTHGSLF